MDSVSATIVEHTIPPLSHCSIRYPVIAEPPSLVGAVHNNFADPFNGCADTPVGAPGAVAAGVTAAEDADAGPVPSRFVAVTVNV